MSNILTCIPPRSCCHLFHKTIPNHLNQVQDFSICWTIDCSVLRKHFFLEKFSSCSLEELHYSDIVFFELFEMFGTSFIVWVKHILRFYADKEKELWWGKIALQKLVMTVTKEEQYVFWASVYISGWPGTSLADRGSVCLDWGPAQTVVNNSTNTTQQWEHKDTNTRRRRTG